jgi:hypothetical protein
MIQVLAAWDNFMADFLPFPGWTSGLNMQCMMDHIVLNGEDDEKMIAFYSKVLMLAPERVEEYPEGNLIEARYYE